MSGCPAQTMQKRCELKSVLRLIQVNGPIKTSTIIAHHASVPDKRILARIRELEERGLIRQVGEAHPRTFIATEKSKRRP